MLKRVSTLIFAAAGLVAAPYASAEIQGYVSGGLGFNAVTGDVVNLHPAKPGDPPALPANSTSGISNFTGQIEGGARFAMPNDDNIIFGVGLYINPFTLKADDENDNLGEGLTIDIKDMRGLVGEVGWKLGASTVAYGKVSLNQGRMEGTFRAPGAITGPITQSFSGIGFGAGLRQSLASNMYVFTEWHHIVGSKVSFALEGGYHNIKPKLTTGLVGAGWTF